MYDDPRQYDGENLPSKEDIENEQDSENIIEVELTDICPICLEEKPIDDLHRNCGK